MQKNYPSVNRISEIKGIDKESAKLVRAIMQEKSRENLENLPIYEKYYQNTGKFMYNCHSMRELRIFLIDLVLNGFGVESAQDNNGHYLEWVNLGDTYDLTVCYYQNRFIVSSWGDIVERGNFN